MEDMHEDGGSFIDEIPSIELNNTDLKEVGKMLDAEEISVGMIDGSDGDDGSDDNDGGGMIDAEEIIVKDQPNAQLINRPKTPDELQSVKETENLIENMWPKGHQFTVAVKVVVPGLMAQFIKMLNHRTVLFGCSVERIDFKDEHEIMKVKNKRVQELMTELNEILMSV